jgi:hypothetical protein
VDPPASQAIRYRSRSQRRCRAYLGGPRVRGDARGPVIFPAVTGMVTPRTETGRRARRGWKCSLKRRREDADARESPRPWVHCRRS